MRRLLCALALLLTPAALSAQGYLSEPALIGPAWDELLQDLPAEPQITAVTILERSIEAELRAASGGRRLDVWRVVRRDGVFGFGKGDVVQGPEPVIASGPVADTSGATLPPGEIRLDAVPQLISGALATVQLTGPGRVTRIRLARDIAILPQPHYGDARWTLTLGNDAESATVEALPDGTVIGADISDTDRGRARDFLSQDGWDFGLAQRGFANLVGQDATVREVSVSRTSVSVTASSPELKGYTTDWSWDGGRFTRSLVDSPDLSAVMSQSDLPFALDEVDLAALPQVLATARAAAPTTVQIQDVRAAKEPKVAQVPAVEWIVRLSGPRPLMGHDWDEDWVVRVGTAGQLVSVLRPKSLRPKVSYLDGPAFAVAMAELAGRLGGETRVLEVMVRPDRLELRAFHPDQRNMTAEFVLTDGGIAEGSPFPVMMQTADDLFPLSAALSLTAERLEAMKARAMQEVAMEGAEVYSLRIWSGTPFWQHDGGMPFVDVRVGIPPRHDDGGYVVFLLDGSHVETVK